VKTFKVKIERFFSVLGVAFADIEAESEEDARKKYEGQLARFVSDYRLDELSAEPMEGSNEQVVEVTEESHTTSISLTVHILDKPKEAYRRLCTALATMEQGHGGSPVEWDSTTYYETSGDTVTDARPTAELFGQ
jgi:hypothetical protein